MKHIGNSKEDLGLWLTLSSEFRNCDTVCRNVSYLMCEGAKRTMCHESLPEPKWIHEHVSALGDWRGVGSRVLESSKASCSIISITGGFAQGYALAVFWKQVHWCCPSLEVPNRFLKVMYEERNIEDFIEQSLEVKSAGSWRYSCLE